MKPSQFFAHSHRLLLVNIKRWTPVIVAFASYAGCTRGGESPDSAVPEAASTRSEAELRAASDSAIYDELFDDAILHELIIEMTQEEWDGVTRDMLDQAKAYPITPLYEGDGRGYRTNNYRKANFIYRRPGGAEIQLSQVGFRSRGNESRRLPTQDGKYYKSHFKVKFDKTFDVPKADPARENLSKRRFAGMKALNFKWSRHNDWDQYASRSKLNELFSYSLLREIGVNAPRMSLATLKLRIAGNEVDYGVYGIVEQVDKAFLRRRYGGSGGDLYKCLYLESGAHLTEDSLSGDRVGVKDPDRNYRPIYDLKTNETRSDHSALKEFVREINAKDGQAFVDYVEARFEVDRFIRYLAMGIYINNLDDYRFLANNYYLYFNDKGKTDFIAYDFDISLGTNWHGGMEYAELINQDILKTKSIPATWGDNSPRPLIDKILSVDKFRERYRRYLEEYVDPKNRLFIYSEYQAKFDQLYALYGSKTKNDTVDPDPMGLAGYEKRYFSDKTKNVLGQLGLAESGYEIAR
jgi:spore coat protein CotH